MTGEVARAKLTDELLGYVGISRRVEFGTGNREDRTFNALKNIVTDYR